jgi:[ribosomal protein S5]-alanine N-acetyltransferase
MSSASNRTNASTCRVFLRAPEFRDYEEFTDLKRASEEFHRPWSPVPPPGVDVYGEQAFAEFVRRNGMVHRRERMLVCRLEDKRILGVVNLNEIVRGSFQSAFLGYWIGAEFANQGYMGEALRLVIEVAFEKLGLHRLEANIRPENEASIRLVRRTGFKKEGFSPRYLQIAGDWCDHERWTILADDEFEWEAESGPG